MGIFESSTISFVNLEPTTSTLTGNTIPGTTTLGASTTTSALWAIDKNEEGEMKVNPKKLVGLMGTTATTSTSTSLNLNSTMAAETKEQADKMGITVEQEVAVNQTRDIEAWFDSLTDDQQVEFLVSLEQKEQKLQNVQSEEKAVTKHL